MSPQKKYFDIAIKFNRYEKITIYISMCISILSLFSKNIPMSNIEDVLCIISILCITLLFVFSAISEQNLFKGENERKLDSFDNAYGTSSAEFNSKDYFDVDDFHLGDEKLLAQLHENCMFTKVISNKMFYKNLKINIFILLFLLAGILFGFLNAKILSVILLVYLSKIYVVNLILIYQLNRYTEELEKEIKSLWDLYINNNNSLIFKGRVISLYVRYESIISHYKVILDEDVYKEVNPILTEEWKKLSKDIIRKIRCCDT